MTLRDPGGVRVYSRDAPCFNAVVKVRDIIKLVEADGWRLVRIKGSHRHYHHEKKIGIVTVAGHPSEDLDPKTQASILKQAGLKK